MYVEIKQDKKCSKCGAVNNFETVVKNLVTLIRCKKCGHEKTLTVITTSLEENEGNYISYQIKDMPKIETF
jgi:Zn ribbon nucleic-acid-binding protein